MLEVLCYLVLLVIKMYFFVINYMSCLMELKEVIQIFCCLKHGQKQRQMNIFAERVIALFVIDTSSRWSDPFNLK